MYHLSQVCICLSERLGTHLHLLAFALLGDLLDTDFDALAIDSLVT